MSRGLGDVYKRQTTGSDVGIEVPVGHDTSGISYSVGCNSCTPQAIQDGPSKSDVVDADELNKMINELVSAFRGE